MTAVTKNAPAELELVAGAASQHPMEEQNMNTVSLSAETDFEALALTTKFEDRLAKVPCSVDWCEGHTFWEFKPNSDEDGSTWANLGHCGPALVVAIPAPIVRSTDYAKVDVSRSLVAGRAGIYVNLEIRGEVFEVELLAALLEEVARTVRGVEL